MSCSHCSGHDPPSPTKTPICFWCFCDKGDWWVSVGTDRRMWGILRLGGHRYKNTLVRRPGKWRWVCDDDDDVHVFLYSGQNFTSYGFYLWHDYHTMMSSHSSYFLSSQPCTTTWSLEPETVALHQMPHVLQALSGSRSQIKCAYTLEIPKSYTNEHGKHGRSSLSSLFISLPFRRRRKGRASWISSPAKYYVRVKGREYFVYFTWHRVSKRINGRITI